MTAAGWLGPVLVLVTGLPLVLLPVIARRTVPLAVSVPSGQVDHPAVRAAKLRYHLATGGATALLAVASWWLPPVAVALGLLVLVAACFAIHSACRRSIIAVKRAEGWYDGERVGLAAAATDTGEVASGAGWFVAAAVLLALDVALTVAVYPSLPDPMPVHFDASGVPDRWVPKSWWTALQPTMIMAATIAFLAVLLGILRRVPLRVTPDGATDRGRTAATARVNLATTVLGICAVMLGITSGAVTVAMAFPAWSVASMVVAVLVPVVLIVAVLWLAVRARRRSEAAAPRDESGNRIETPDDDRHWIGGLVYRNRDDPSLLVLRRYGIGWSLNLGHPAGVAIAVALAVVLFATITLLIALGVTTPSGRN